MRISTKGRYAIRLMIDIAQHSSDGNVSLKDVSKRQDKYAVQGGAFAKPARRAGWL